MSATWKFVDTPVAIPATLLDMNDKIDYALDLGRGFDISPPVLNKSISGNSLIDGGILTSSHFDNRLLKFNLAIDPHGARTTQQKEQLLTELNMELAKPSNLIMYKPSPQSEPVFFQTIRSDDYGLDYGTGSKRPWKVSCVVEALPFGIGLRQSLLSNVAITNNPASGTNQAKVDITGVEGDTPSPAFIRLGTTLPAGTTFVLGQKTDNATALNPFVQCETGTLGLDTTLPGNDAAMSGTGSNYARTTFATTPLVLSTRLTVTLPTTIRGTYRVYARIRTGTATATYQMRARYIGASAFYGGSLAEFSSTTQKFMLIDLGVMDFPYPAPTPPQFGYSRLTGTYPSQSMEIRAARSAGSGNLDMDYVYLFPADEILGSFQAVNSLGFLIVDGQQDKAYGMTSGSDPFSGTRVVDSAGAVVPLFGGIPMLVPGVTNRWFMLRETDAITVTTNVWVDYWPQWKVVATP